MIIIINNINITDYLDVDNIVGANSIHRSRRHAPPQLRALNIRGPRGPTLDQGPPL